MELTDSEIICIRNRIFSSNTYLLRNIDSSDCIVIDPGLDTESIANRIEELKLYPKAILSTHGHFDHIGSVAYLKSKYNIPFHLHENDLKLSQSANFFLKIAKIDHKIDTSFPDVLLKGETQLISIGNYEIESHLYPGHTEGSCIFKFKKNIFTGDILYKTGLGFNGFPGENKMMLKQSIIKVLKSYDPDLMVYPGHGNFAMLQDIKNNNSELKKFISL